MTYIIIFIILLAAELVYFRVADHFNIIDKPNERSSHSTIVLRGGGIIFTISMIVWYFWFGTMEYIPFMIGLILIAGISFWDDIHSLSDSVRLVTQFVAIGLIFWSMGIMHWDMWFFVAAGLFVCVGATNIINFMDGINGITAAYSLAVLVPLLMIDVRWQMADGMEFIEPSYLIVAILGVLIFCIFNFRPKGKAKCFAGDVGSIGIAFIMLFAVGRLIVQTMDVTYLVLLLVYGIDGCMTIIHRIMLHENIGEAHRKHAFQLMANELKIGHVKVSLLYMVMQLAVSLGFIYLCPNTLLAHWVYAIAAIALLALGYIVFMKKFYHLHEEYLATLKN